MGTILGGNIIGRTPAAGTPGNPQSGPPQGAGSRWPAGVQNPSGGQNGVARPSYGGGSNVKEAQPAMAMGGPVKGEGARAAHYAEGGPVTGRSRSFMKEPDPFSAGMAVGDSKFKKMTPDEGSPQDYAGGKPKGKSKADVTTPMPRK